MQIIFGDCQTELEKLKDNYNRIKQICKKKKSES